MNRIYFVILIILLQGCKEKEPIAISYNQKANELLRQIILKDSCDCILEFNSKSIVDAHKDLQPSLSYRKVLQLKLKTENLTTLDSLVSLSDNFKLDNTILSQNNKIVKVITLDQLIKFRKDNTLEVFKICPSGVRIFQKPAFSKDFKIAVVHQRYPFGCDGGMDITYLYKNNKWIAELD